MPSSTVNPHEPHEPHQAHASRARLLIVDDEPMFLEAWAMILESYGFEPARAYSASSALQQAAHRPPDLLITDLMMPAMDGLALCRELRARPDLSHIPVVLWSAAEVKMADAPFDLFLPKHASVQTVVEQINALLARARSHR